MKELLHPATRFLAIACLVWPLATYANINVTGVVLVDGNPISQPPGDLDVGPNATIQIDPLATLIINGGSDLLAGFLQTTGVTGISTLEVNGPGSRLVLNGNGVRLRTGQLADLRVLNGAVIDAATAATCLALCPVLIGEVAGSTTTLSVSGVGSEFLVRGDLLLGQAATDVALAQTGASIANVTVDGGGRIAAGRVLIGAGTVNDINQLSTSEGIVTLSGTGSRLDAGAIIVGAGPFATGTLSIENGAFVESTGLISIADTASAQGVINVNGNGSFLNALDNVVIGAQGSGRINVASGGRFDVNRTLTVGRSDNETLGLLNISGAGTQVTVRENVIVGAGSLGSGQISVMNGAALSIGAVPGFAPAPSFMAIGRGTSAGTVSVNAASVSITTTRPNAPYVGLLVGENGNGDLSLTNGANFRVEVAANANPLALLRVGVSELGGSAAGNVVIDQSTLQLSGPNVRIDAGIVTNGGPTGVADATLSVANGGVLSLQAQNMAEIRLGSGAAAIATLDIDNSRMSVSGGEINFFIGMDELNSTGSAFAGVTVTNNGLLELTASDPNLSALFVGRGSGDGQLIINNGGVVTTNGQVFISAPNGAVDTQTGFVSIDVGGRLTARDVMVGNRGTLVGSGDLFARELRLRQGAVFGLANLGGIDSLVYDGNQSVLNALSLGRTNGQGLSITNGGRLELLSDFNLGSAAATRASATVQSSTTPANLVVAGALQLGNATGGPSALTVGANGNVAISGALNVANGSTVSVAGSSAVLNAASMDFNGGTLNITANATVGATTGITLRNGATLSGDTSPVTNSLTLQSGSNLSNGVLGNIGTINLDASTATPSALDLRIGNTSPTGMIFTAANASFINTQTLSIGFQPGSAGVLALNTGSRLQVSGVTTVGGSGRTSLLSFNGNSTADLSQRVQVNAGGMLSVADTGSLVGASLIDITGGTVSVTNNGTISASEIKVESGGRLQGNGTVLTPLLRLGSGGVMTINALDGVARLQLENGLLSGAAFNFGRASDQTLVLNGSSQMLMTGDVSFGSIPGTTATVALNDTSNLSATNILFNNSTLNLSGTAGLNARQNIVFRGASTLFAVNSPVAALLDVRDSSIANVNALTSVNAVLVSGPLARLSSAATNLVLGSNQTGGQSITAADNAAMAFNSLLIGTTNRLSATIDLLRGATLTTSGDVTLGGSGELSRVTVSQNASATIGGRLVLDQQGRFVVADGGSLTANVIDVKGGTLDVQTNGRVSASRASVLTGGVFSLQDATTITAYDIAAGGTLASSGNLLLQRTGGQTVNLTTGGTLQSPGRITIGSGTTLSGSGTVNAGQVEVLAGGLISPGNSPGSISINGDLVLNGGRLLFEIAGKNPGQFDVLDVRGNMQLDRGTVELLQLNGYFPEPGDAFEIFKVTGNANIGPGAQLLSTGLGPDYEVVFRDDGNVKVGTLQFLAIDIAELTSLSENQAELAGYLDDVCPRIERQTAPDALAQDLDTICGGLRNFRNSPEQVAAALSAIAPEEVLAVVDSLLSFTTLQHGTLGQRLSGLRTGRSRVDVSGINLVGDHVQIAGRDLQHFIEGLVGGSAGAAEDFARWGFFADGNLQLGEQDRTAQEAGYDFDTLSLTFGADYRVTDTLFIGGAFGYNETNSDFDSGGGMRVKGTSLSLMSSYFVDAFYLDALATFAWTDADTTRFIRYTDVGGSIDRRATGKTDGTQVIVTLGSGFDWNRGAWTFGPHAGASYTENLLNDFNEQGALALNLSIPDQVSRSLTGNAGAHVSYAFTQNWGVLIPYLRLEYVHEFKSAGQASDVSLAADRFRFDPLNPTTPTRLRMNDAASDYWSWSLGAHAQFINGVAAFVGYRSVEGLSDLNLGDITAGLRFERAF